MLANLYRYLFVLLLVICSSFTSLRSEYLQKEYIVVNHPSYMPGMFSVFGTVLGFLDAYEKGDYAGLKVDFGKQGHYYDRKRGSNWWEYYCEPIALGSSKNAYKRYYAGNECIAMAMGVECHMSRQRAHQLIRKYIKIKGDILRKVDNFCRRHLDACHVIGLHYRGTDKSCEAPRVSYEAALCAVLEYVQCLPNDDYRIFLATDEQAFLEYMVCHLPGKVVARNAYRSHNGASVHHSPQCNPFEKGQQALIDALLLSKCELLIRTSSNLSLWSTYFNPSLRVHMLNQRYGG